MDIEKIVTNNYNIAAEWVDDDMRTPLDAAIKEVITEVELHLHWLTKELYEQQLDNGYDDGYVEEKDVGSYVWDDGETYNSHRCITGWLILIKSRLQEYRTPNDAEQFQEWVKLASIRDILAQKNNTP